MITINEAIASLLTSQPPRSIEYARDVITAMERHYGRPCVFPPDFAQSVKDRLEIFRHSVAYHDKLDAERKALGYTEEAFQNLLSDLRKLDANGYADLTDGSLNGMGIEERCEIVKKAIRLIQSQDNVYVVFPDDVRLARSHKYPVLIKKGTRVYFDGDSYMVYGKWENYEIPAECVAIQSGAGSL